MFGERDREHQRNIKWLAEWLSDPARAQAAAAFPLDDGTASSGGVYAWHGDDVAAEAVRTALGPVTPGPLYVGQIATPMNTRIVRTHLRNTRESTLRRSFASILWGDSTFAARNG